MDEAQCRRRIRGFVLAGAARGGRAAEPIRLLAAYYESVREVFADLDRDFARHTMAERHLDVIFEHSEGGSTNEAHAIVDGLLADIAVLASSSDMTLLAKAGLIRADWRQVLPDNATPYSSTVGFLVRKGNPKAIRHWRDLLEPGVTAVASNPKTSGSGRWCYLSLWAALAGAPSYDIETAAGAAAAAEKAVAAAAETAAAGSSVSATDNVEVRRAVAGFYDKQVVALKSSARGATEAFIDGEGDVLLNWENELYRALDLGGRDRFEIVYPASAVMGELPVAVVDSVVEVKGTREVAEAYVQYLYSDEAQETFARHRLRPRNPAVLARHRDTLPPLKVFLVEQAFGGWDKADAAFFADGGIFDRDVVAERQP